MKIFHTLVLCLLMSISTFAQDLEQNFNSIRNISDQKLNITGGIQLSNQSYFSSGIDPRRDALQWMARANLNFSFMGISAPFSFVFSDENRQFRLPSYTFTGISPTYKWATLHLGDRNMSFSKYTMSGISFRGVGAEVRPSKFYAGMMYGNLRRAQAEDLTGAQSLDAAYKRMGYGLKVGYSDKKMAYHLIFFNAADEANSIAAPIENPITPANNTIISLQGRQQLTKKIAAEGEWAHSIFNKDNRSPNLLDAEKTLGNSLFGLSQPTESITTGDAYRANLFYTANGFGLRGGYERITRGYRTLGALFFNNDTENITAGFNKNFWKNKLSIFVNGGLERTNMDNAELETTNRIIGSVNATYRPDEIWLFVGSYSNFQNSTKLRAQTNTELLVDSIFLAQVTQSSNFMVTRRLGSEKRPSSISLILSAQNANSIVNDEIMADSRTRFLNATTSYSYNVPDRFLGLNAGISVANIQLLNQNTLSFSPTVGLSKAFFNNTLRTSYRASYSHFLSNGITANSMMNLSTSGAYTFKNNHNLGLTITFLNRFGAANATANFSETYARINYGYRFGGSLGFKKK